MGRRGTQLTGSIMYTLVTGSETRSLRPENPQQQDFYRVLSTILQRGVRV
jgi:hypothetical protein